MEKITLPGLLLFQIVIFILILKTTSAQEDSESSKPFGVLHEKEDKTGKSISYFEYASEFQDVQQLLTRHQMEKAALFCGDGVFIFYNTENFASETNEDIRLFSGSSKDSCVMPGSSKSILFIQRYTDPTEDTLAFFDLPHFSGSLGNFKIINGEVTTVQSLEGADSLGSLVLMGSSNWEVTTNKETYCLIPPPGSGEYPICPLTNATELFPKDRNWIEAKIGCDKKKKLKVKTLKSCFSRGTGTLEEVQGSLGVIEDEVEEAGSSTEIPTPVTEIFPSVKATKVCNFSDEFAMLLRFKVLHDFESAYQIQFPLNKVHSWRTEILDNTMEIVISCVPSNLVAPKFLRFIREMYIYLAEKLVWTQGKAWPLKPKQRVLHMGYQTEQCLKLIEKRKWYGVIESLGDVVRTKSDIKGVPNELIDEDLKPLEGIDTVMEFIWLSVNFVASVCHAVLEFQMEFWMDYVSLAHDMYLNPMILHWRDPGHYSALYPTLLGGYGIFHQQKALAAVVSLLYKASALDKLPRPLSVGRVVDLDGIGDPRGSTGINWKVLEDKH